MEFSIYYNKVNSLLALNLDSPGEVLWKLLFGILQTMWLHSSTGMNEQKPYC